MKHKVYKPVLAWLSVLLLLLLAACGGGTGPDFSNQEGVEVNIFAGLGSTSSSSVETSDLETQGVPSNPETGETGVDSAELEVFSGDTQLFFNDGRIVDEGAGDTVTLTPDDSEVALFLPQGSYRFVLTALDDQGNVLAQGETEQQVDEDSRVSIPLVSLIGSARFEVPESIKGNQVFDAFLRVSPPNRPDLEVALGDFSVTYDVQEPSVQLEGSSNIGVRVAAACDVVEVTATIDNDLSDTVTANATVPVNDPTCEGTGTDVGTDLVSPYVSINTPQADATLNKSFTLQGDVNDQQSGIDKVEVYEGTVKLGDATVDTDNRSWSFDASLDDGSYTLIAVAFDKAGNSSRAEVNVSVKEGSGNEVDNCTSPVEIPEEFLERDIREELGKPEGELTCEDLERLVELSAGPEGDDDRISSLEGLQYAVNLERLSVGGNQLRDLEPLRDLPKLTELTLGSGGTGTTIDISALADIETLKVLRFVETGLVSLEPLRGLIGLQDLELFDVNVDEGDASVLQTLTGLQRIVLNGVRGQGISAIRDLAPFVNNEGLGRGDILNIRNNLTLGDTYLINTCAGSDDREAIDALIARGVDVKFNQRRSACRLVEAARAEECVGPVDISDERLAARIRMALESGGLEGELTGENLAELFSLFVPEPEGDEAKVQRLEGLQCAVDLQRLDVKNNQIEDLSPLQTLTLLKDVQFFDGQISDLTPTRNLVNLNSLNLGNNDVNELAPLIELVNNGGLAGIDTGNVVQSSFLGLGGNPLDTCPGSENRKDLDTLIERIGRVSFGEPENCDGEGGNGGGDGGDDNGGDDGGDNGQTCSNPVNIPDDSLQQALAQNLDEPGEITCEALAGLERFEIDLFDPSGLIENFEGLQYATNLKVFKVTNFSLTPEQVAFLGDLTSLESLRLSLIVEDKSALSFLANLTNLETLSIASSTVPEPGQEDRGKPALDLSPLRNLTELTDLFLTYFTLDDLTPLQNLTNLTSLRLPGNEISDVSPLENLTGLNTLNLRGIQISDSSLLQNLTNLTELSLGYTGVSTFPLQNLTKLTRLELDGNEIDDLSSLQNLTNLSFLDLSANKISDLSPLQGLTNLAGLSLANNQISEVGPLVANEGLDEGDLVSLRENPLELCPGTQSGDDIETLELRGVNVSIDSIGDCGP